jgi:hypothetical protein
MRIENIDIQNFTIYHKMARGIILICTVLLGISPLSGQSESEVYLFDFILGDGGFEVSAPVNISQNPGYDNQPHFLSGDDLLYARTRNDQTDIARYSLSDQKTTWLSDTPGGSEYSPTKIPGRNAVSAIRLDTDGLQRLYSYPLEGGQPQLLIPDLKIGYHLWYSPEILICTVLIEDRMDLVVINFKDKSQYTFQKGVGRSLHRIPGSERISYTSPGEGKVLVKSMDPKSGSTAVIATLPDGVQDLCWLDKHRLICGQGNELKLFNTQRKGPWKSFYAFENSEANITRLDYYGSKGVFAIVVETQD